MNQVQIACSKAGQPVIRCDFTNHLPNEILLILFLFIIALTDFIEKLYGAYYCRRLDVRKLKLYFDFIILTLQLIM